MAYARRRCLTALAAAAMLAVVAACPTGAATAMPDAKPPTAGWDPMLHDRVDAVPVTLAELAGTTWLAEDIDRRGVLDRAQSRLHVASDRAVDGNAGCNSFHGSAAVTSQGLQFGPLATTRKACSAALMDQERRFLDALGRVRSATTSHGLLFLRDAEGVAILRFSRLSAASQGS